MQQPAPQPAPADQPPESPLQNAQGNQPEAGTPSQESSNVASTLQVYAYPKANQTPGMQSQDESECYQWAQGQGAPPEQQGAQQSTNEAGMGTAAAGSSGSAAVAGNPEGATSSAAAGHHKKKKAQQESDKEQQTQQAPATDNVKRAYSACMESRNYTIK